MRKKSSAEAALFLVLSPSAVATPALIDPDRQPAHGVHHGVLELGLSAAATATFLSGLGA